MDNNVTSKQDPLIRIAKRDGMPFYISWCIRGIAFIASMVIYVAIVQYFTGLSPLDTLSGILKGAFGTTDSRLFSDITLWKTIRNILILYGVALALVPAFKMRYWNIGGEGQILIGGLVTAICMKFLSEYVTGVALIAILFIASIIAGAIWSAIPSIFKATHNTNETLFTLMMNYVAIQLVAFFNIVLECKPGFARIDVINEATQAGWLPQTFLSNIVGEDGYVIIALFIAAAAVFMYFYMNKTKHGYEISVLGDSHDTARYAGINVKKVIIRTAALSGALCGMVGFLLVSGASHTITVDTAGNRGFTAIIVAWLGKLNVFYMLLVSTLLTVLGAGANELASYASLDTALGDVLTGIVLFFILASEFFVNYKLIFRHSHRRVEE